MDPLSAISCLGSILQLLGDAATTATKAARFINNVRGAPQAQYDLQKKLQIQKQTLDYLQDRLRSRQLRQNGAGSISGGMNNINSGINCRQEEEQILQMAGEICSDCKDCSERLEHLIRVQNPSASLLRRAAGEFRREVRKDEVDRLEAKLQANVGNIQLLLTCLQLYVMLFSLS